MKQGDLVRCVNNEPNRYFPNGPMPLEVGRIYKVENTSKPKNGLYLLGVKDTIGSVRIAFNVTRFELVASADWSGWEI